MSGGGVTGVIGDITGSTHRAEKRTAKRAGRATQNAVNVLDPNAILKIVQQFMSPSNAALMGMMNQSQDAARTGLARRGLTGTGFGNATLAGIPAAFNMQAYIDALQRAMQISSQKAGVYANQPIVQGEPNPVSVGFKGTPSK